MKSVWNKQTIDNVMLKVRCSQYISSKYGKFEDIQKCEILDMINITISFKLTSINQMNNLM
jgi:hypothetical protein